MVPVASVAHQLNLFENESTTHGHALRHGQSIAIGPLDATFHDSSRAPFHSWFPYLEGYSPRFVQAVMQEYLPGAKRILEPFAGSGTTPIVLGQAGVECAYSEANPAMAFIAETKLSVLGLDSLSRATLANDIKLLHSQLSLRTNSVKPDQKLQDSYEMAFRSSVYFDDGSFADILRLRVLADEVLSENPILGKCFVVAILASLIPASRLKRAGDLRFKTLKELQVPAPPVIRLLSERLLSQANEIPGAIELRAPTRLACDTAAELAAAVDGKWDGVITSPPYLNGTNYIRNARLELWFLRELRSKADLRRMRDKVITSGINDVDAQTDWCPVSEGVKRTVNALEQNAYDPRIAKMVGGYFRDMRIALGALATCVREQGRLCVDIGDSIYGGVHVPTDDLLVEVAESVSLRTIERVHLRTRMSKGGERVRQQLLVFEKRGA